MPVSELHHVLVSPIRCYLALHSSVVSLIKVLDLIARPMSDNLLRSQDRDGRNIAEYCLLFCHIPVRCVHILRVYEPEEDTHCNARCAFNGLTPWRIPGALTTQTCRSMRMLTVFIPSR